MLDKVKIDTNYISKNIMQIKCVSLVPLTIEFYDIQSWRGS